MARPSRLLDILHLLHRQVGVVPGRQLAEQLGMSPRTLDRDIATLRALGVEIEGDPERGYRLTPGIVLAPLHLPVEEVEALLLGVTEVAEHADPDTAQAARSAAARIMAAMTPEQAMAMRSTLSCIDPDAEDHEGGDPLELDAAIREERRMHLVYRDIDGDPSRRIIWPFATSLYNRADVLIGWCELRGDYRTFRIDRIVSARLLPDRYPRRRTVLLREWRQRPDIAHDRYRLHRRDADQG
ncbi:MAG: helix-turn-helix transcriptional regulator [Sphingomonas pseudosanguinis]|uniref:helix-turn-helix transcriptional regulator n=1 Tax=Sphingomonas pseudosanguinis TaxID=413712 RepID=UPI003918EBB5